MDEGVPLVSCVGRVGSVGSVGRRRRPGRAAGARHVLVVLARSAVQPQALPDVRPRKRMGLRGACRGAKRVQRDDTGDFP